MRRVLLGLLVLVLAYFAVTTTLVARWMGKDERPRVDAIVVLGAAQYDGRPSAIYEARLEHAVELWRGQVGALRGVRGGEGRGTAAPASAASRPRPCWSRSAAAPPTRTWPGPDRPWRTATRTATGTASWSAPTTSTCSWRS